MRGVACDRRVGHARGRARRAQPFADAPQGSLSAGRRASARPRAARLDPPRRRGPVGRRARLY